MGEFLHRLIGDRETIGVVAVNSPDFVKTVFKYLGSDKIVVFLQDERDTYKIRAAGISQIVTPEEGFGWCEFEYKPRFDRSIAQISFTSGTTGLPKGVILTHEALTDVVTRLQEIMELEPSIREYVGIPVNYSFGFGRCRAVSAVGGRFYIPKSGFNPLEIRDMLSEGSINAISAVPSLWRSLLECEEIFGRETQRVKWIEIGSQYMSKSEKERLLNLFPNAKIVQHYGLTEASRTSFLRIDYVKGEHLESVGKAYGKTEIDISNEGKIRIRGPHVAQKLIVEGSITDNIEPDGWHETKDLGEIKEGYLYYLGRADDLINCGGIKVYPDAFERVLREELGIDSGIAVTKINDSVRGNNILVATLAGLSLNFESLKEATMQVAKQFNIKSEDAIKFVEVEEFPSTATGKIRRKELAKQYEENLSSHSISTCNDSNKVDYKPLENDDIEEEIALIWKDVLNLDRVEHDRSFFELGGDSLTVITVMLKMEKRGISKDVVKGMLQGLSVKEVASRLQDKDLPKTEKINHSIKDPYMAVNMAINIVRGILVASVVSGHWFEGTLNRLPGIFEQVVGLLNPLLALFFAAGTPGFAIIYGVTLGYSVFEIYKINRNRFFQNTFNTGVFLFIGVLTLATFRFGLQIAEGNAETFTDFTNSFYSILSYYFLITLTLPLWIGFLSRFKFPSQVAIFCSVTLYCIYHFILAPLGGYQAEGFIELGKILVSAKYSYFNLTAGTLVGFATGTLIRSNIKEKRVGIPTSFVWIGLASVAAGFVISSHAGVLHTWLEWPREIGLWVWCFYYGLIIVALSSLQKMLKNYNRYSTLVKFIFQSLSTLGVLAFPMFVLHSLVIPMKIIMSAGLGLQESVAIILSMTAFLVVFGFLFKKVYQANYTW